MSQHADSSLGAEVEMRVLHANDVAWMRSMLSMFGAAFEDEATYTRRQPDDAYLDVLHFGIHAAEGAA